ncbi:hypothetical protein, partial [Mobiluncus mulieris]|uniref:hypothetical protein n=1 Tax=Mobiluncus mulieris TaxID=2052 RepID=UPI001B8B3548
RSVSLSNGVAKRNYEHPQVATPADASRFAAGAPAGRLLLTKRPRRSTLGGKPKLRYKAA